MLIAAWSKFLGANLMLNARLLPDGLGVNASNIRVGFGDLRPWSSASTVVTTGGGTPLISAYRMNRATVSDVSAWIQWPDDVDVVRSLIGNDSTEEIYFSGSGVLGPLLTDNTIGLPAAPGPAASRSLGIPAPTAVMTATLLVAGGGASESRVYVDTFYNDKNRESAPGIARQFTCLGGSTVTLSALVAAPGGSHGINRRRIYCSTDGSDFRLVLEQGSGPTTAVDNLVRGVVLQSGGDVSKPAWLVPPVDLRGLIGLWNGMIGGHFGKSFGVCVPYKPWAWPVEYQDSVYDDIVGTGKWRQAWVLLTTSAPVIVTGSSPDSLSHDPVPFLQACVSKRSVVSMGFGVAWASPEGLCIIGDQGPRIVTEGILSPEQWQAMAPTTMIGARIEQRYYYGAYNDGVSKAFMIDVLNPGSGIIYLTQGARGVFYDPISDRLYLQDTGNTIKRWAGGSSQACVFKTGVKRHPQPTNPGYGMLVSDLPISALVKLNALILQDDGTYVWTEVFSRTVTSGQPFALPSGYMAQDFQGEVTTTAPVLGLLIAEDVADLP